LTASLKAGSPFTGFWVSCGPDLSYPQLLDGRGRPVSSEIRSVAHVVPAIFRKKGGVIGGAERYVLELAKAMAERVETTLYSFADQSESWTDGKLRIQLVKRSFSVRSQPYNPFSFGLLPRLMRHTVVHCHQTQILTSSVVAMLGLVLRKPVFVTDLGGGGWDVSRYISTERWFSGHLHISDYSRRMSKDLSAQHSVIYGGVDGARFSLPKHQARRESVLFVGRLMPHKGINYLIEAVGDDIPLTIIGQPYNEAYTRLLQEIARGKNVVFKKDCDDEGLIEHYQNAKACVLPSVYSDVYGAKTLVPELLGQTLLEAMACGTPAIGTDVASMPEVVVDGETGFVVKPNDPLALRAALLRLRGNAVLIERLGAAGRRRALTEFSWESVVERCLTAYRSVQC
jgi:glycosyltransferase involved in cell wall biosynthesis